MEYKKHKMYILKHCETGEYIASKFRGYGKYELVSLCKLKDDKIYFKENEKIKNLFSKSYHVHFRGGDINIKLHEIINLKEIGSEGFIAHKNLTKQGQKALFLNQEKINKSYDLKSINPKDLFKSHNNNNESVLVN
jgi:hypothetical protein